METSNRTRAKRLFWGLVEETIHRHRLGNEYSFVEVRGTDSVLLASMYASHTLVAYPIVILLRCVAASQCEYCSGGRRLRIHHLLVLAVVGMFKGVDYFWVWLVIKGYLPGYFDCISVST